MNNHDYRHYQGQNMHEVVRGLEDERVGDLNGPRVTVCLDPGAAIDLLPAHQRAQWYRRLCAYRREVAEAHVCGLFGVCGVVRRAGGCEGVQCRGRRPMAMWAEGGQMERQERSK
jgi:hypothetical protein